MADKSTQTAIADSICSAFCWQGFLCSLQHGTLVHQPTKRYRSNHALHHSILLAKLTCCQQFRQKHVLHRLLHTSSMTQNICQQPRADSKPAYCRCADLLVRLCHDEAAEVMIASHNQKSIERAVSLMHEIGVEPSQSGIYFGQLLGMADHLSFILGRNGYRVSSLQLFCILSNICHYSARS